MFKAIGTSIGSLVGGLALAVCLALPASADYSLVWSDEFDGSSLNTADWTIDIGDGCPDLCGWGNSELEYYRSQNVAVSGGHLALTAKEEWYGGRNFTSGKILTRDKQSFLYGRIEARAKIPTGGGMWPAFWLMPQDDAYGGWAASGEIDIMESANATDYIDGTLHFGGSWPNNSHTGGTHTEGGLNFADDFHVYAIEWEQDQIRWYVDEHLYSTKNYWQWWSDGAPGNNYAPFDQDFFLILNVAVGGNYTNCWDPGCVTDDLPQDFLVDYVRVYQTSANNAPTVAITYPTGSDSPDPGDITITSTASDTDGSVVKVEFFAGYTLLGEDTSAPFEFLWENVPYGAYEITVKAYDDDGAYATDTESVAVGFGQAPYHGAPFALPALIEAEDFDFGGEGVAYHDLDGANVGGGYRPSEGVDIGTCEDVGGGWSIGWIGTGEWLEYTVDVPVTADYPIELRVAANSSVGYFRIEQDGVDVTGSVATPVTGGWQTWTTLAIEVPLVAGESVLRFYVEDSGFNLNSIDVLEPTSAGDMAPARTTLHAAYPNPFNPKTTIRYDLMSAGPVRLTVFDIAGRAVKHLIDEEFVEAGRHAIDWNGRDAAGLEAAAGVYLYRLEAEGRFETRRMTLLK